jgi:putative FmdB family regulatory protein
MPIYSYKCPFGHEFDKLVQKMDSSPQTCEKCGQSAEQVLSLPSPFQWGRGGKP